MNVRYPDEVFFHTSSSENVFNIFRNSRIFWDPITNSCEETCSAGLVQDKRKNVDINKVIAEANAIGESIDLDFTSIDTEEVYETNQCVCPYGQSMINGECVNCLDEIEGCASCSIGVDLQCETCESGLMLTPQGER